MTAFELNSSKPSRALWQVVQISWTSVALIPGKFSSPKFEIAGGKKCNKGKSFSRETGLDWRSATNWEKIVLFNFMAFNLLPALEPSF